MYMDITIINNGKKNDSSFQITEVPKGIEPIHTGYGLTIFGVIRNSYSAERTVVKPRMFRFYGISQLLSGNGWRWTEPEGRTEFISGSFVITTPGLIHDYAGNGTEYREDAISFSGHVADSLYNAGIIKDGIFFAGSDRKLLPIIELSMNPDRESQIEANIKLQELLLSIYRRSVDSRLNEKDYILDELLNMIRENPEKWWQVKEMARFCSLSESHFRLRFRGRTGVSPKQYIDSVKMKLACELLAGTDKFIEGIASQLGYVDPLHFSRRFKSYTGLSPTVYRATMSRNT